MGSSVKFKPLIRYFNQIEDEGEYYRKRSVHIKKIAEEFHFLSNIPCELQSFYPKVKNFEIHRAEGSYLVKKVDSLDASNLIINSRTDECEIVLQKLYAYLKVLPAQSTSASGYKINIFENIFHKNLSRVRELKGLAEYNDLNLLTYHLGFRSVQDYCLELNNEINQIINKRKSHYLYFSHGDLCLSNILPTAQSIYFIDPKGYSGHIDNTFRSICYDLAKISQCILGRYDFINHGLFEMNKDALVFGSPYEPTTNMNALFKMILDHFGYELRDIRVIEASLFLSMLPHHRESKTKMLGFLANSINIFKSVR